MAQSNYNRPRRNPQSERGTTLSPNQIRQIETAFEKLEQQVSHWKTKARQWETVAAEAQAQKNEWESRSTELQRMAADAQARAAECNAQAKEWAAAVEEAQAQITNWQAKANQLASIAAETEEQTTTWEQALQEAEQERAEMEDRLSQEQADFQATKVRLARRYAGEAEEEKMRFTRDLLPALDNLERAIEYAPDGEASAEQAGILREGIELTRRAFLEALAQYDVQPIGAAGEPFDPQLHEAIGTLTDAALPPGTIVKVEQNGYTYKDKLLRPARVLVTPLA